MDVEMVEDLLVPGMRKGDEAELSAKSVVRVRSEVKQRFRDGFEKYVDCDSFVAENDRIQLVGDGEVE